MPPEKCAPARWRCHATKGFDASHADSLRHVDSTARILKNESLGCLRENIWSLRAQPLRVFEALSGKCVSTGGPGGPGIPQHKKKINTSTHLLSKAQLDFNRRKWDHTESVKRKPSWQNTENRGASRFLPQNTLRYTHKCLCKKYSQRRIMLDTI